MSNYEGKMPELVDDSIEHGSIANAQSELAIMHGLDPGTSWEVIDAKIMDDARRAAASREGLNPDTATLDEILAISEARYRRERAEYLGLNPDTEATWESIGAAEDQQWRERVAKKRGITPEQVTWNRPKRLSIG